MIQLTNQKPFKSKITLSHQLRMSIFLNSFRREVDVLEMMQRIKKELGELSPTLPAATPVKIVVGTNKEAEEITDPDDSLEVPAE